MRKLLFGLMLVAATATQAETKKALPVTCNTEITYDGHNHLPSTNYEMDAIANEYMVQEFEIPGTEYGIGLRSLSLTDSKYEMHSYVYKTSTKIEGNTKKSVIWYDESSEKICEDEPECKKVTGLRSSYGKSRELVQVAINNLGPGGKLPHLFDLTTDKKIGENFVNQISVKCYTKESFERFRAFIPNLKKLSQKKLK